MIRIEKPSRRALLTLSVAALASARPAFRPRGGRKLYQLPAEPSTVALIKGSDRRQNIYNSLKLIEDQVFAGIGDKTVLIKPNFVQTSKPLAATHVDAVRGVLEFLRTHHKKQVLVAEAAAPKEGTIAGFKNYGYYPLEKEYKVKLVDLNLGAWRHRYVIDGKNAPLAVRICEPFFDPNLYIISLAILKTHGYVSVTLSLKNILLGAPLNDYKSTNDKLLMHLGPHGDASDLCHFNMFHLAQEIFPDLAVIDGFTGMEGDGPSRGTPIESRIALASVDPLAADTLGARLMGFDPKKILYLSSMAQAGMGQGDYEKIAVLGDKAEDCSYHFKPSPMIKVPPTL
jgi:uncharacterized protein (DUF362 family)